MAYNNGIVIAPITDTDIANATGYGSYNIGQCVINGTIVSNSWKKPCKHPETDPLSLAQWREANYGWGIPYGSLGDVARDIGFNDSQYLWWANKPNGGDYEPFRYTDFEGYNINSPHPFKLRALENTYKKWDFFHFAIDEADELAEIAEWGEFNDGSATYQSKPMLALWFTTSPRTHGDTFDYRLYIIGGGDYGLTINDALSSKDSFTISPSNMQQLVDEYSTSVYVSLLLIKNGSGFGGTSRIINVRGGDIPGVVRTAYAPILINVTGGGSGDNAQDYINFSIASKVFDEVSGYLTSITYYCEILSGGGIQKVSVTTSLTTRLGDDIITNSKTFSSSAYWTVNYNRTIDDDGGRVWASLRATYQDNSVQTFDQPLSNIWK